VGYSCSVEVATSEFSLPNLITTALCKAIFSLRHICAAQLRALGSRLSFMQDSIACMNTLQLTFLFRTTIGFSLHFAYLNVFSFDMADGLMRTHSHHTYVTVLQCPVKESVSLVRLDFLRLGWEFCMRLAAFIMGIKSLLTFFCL